MLKSESEVDRLAEQRQAKREQTEIFDLATPPRRSEGALPKTCEAGVQATVDVCNSDTQTDTSLPTRIIAVWHCQIPPSIVDMARDDNDESIAPLSSDEDSGPSESPVVAGPSNDTSQEVASHLPDEAGGSRNVSEIATDMEIENTTLVPDDTNESSECEEGSMDSASPSQDLIADDDPMSPGQDFVSSTQSYLSDIVDKPERDYFMEIDSLGDRPPFVKELIDRWDGLLDEGRWTTGKLYYEDGSIADGRIEIGLLTYDESGHDRYHRKRPVHWSQEVAEHSGTGTSDGRKVFVLRDQDFFAVSREVRDQTPPSTTGTGKAGGRRLRMARGMTVDSGAADNVIPRRMAKGRFNRIRPSKGSKAGVHYVSASSTRIPNEGECDFRFQTKDGQKENYTFQIAEVNQALCAVSYLVDQSNQVIFDRDKATGLDISRIITKTTGRIINMTRERNVWTIDAFIEEDPDEAGDFGRRG